MGEFKVDAVSRKDGAQGTVVLKLLGAGAGRRLVRLRASLDQKWWTKEGGDYFEALQQVRRGLEADGWLLVCYGASRNVYPSGMDRDMGMGLTGCRLHVGQPGRAQDVVRIFDSGPDVEPSTVDEQDAFHRAWVESLGRRLQ